jgi:hypothetical protein
MEETIHMRSIQTQMREVFDLLAENDVIYFDSAVLDHMILAELSSRENEEDASFSPREMFLSSLEKVWDKLYQAKQTEIPASTMLAGVKVYLACESCFPRFENMPQREKVNYIMRAYNTVGQYRVQDVNMFAKYLFVILNSTQSDIFKTFRRRDGIWEFDHKFPHFLSYRSGTHTNCFQPYDFWHEVAILAGAREYYSDPKTGAFV